MSLSIYPRQGPRIALVIFRQLGKPWTARSTCTRSKSYTTYGDFEELLSEPTWSVKALLPTEEQQASNTEAISPKQLRHLLNLSALPAPKTAEDEAKTLKTLSSQLHFVQAIREVDAEGVTPLAAVRDETSTATQNLAISVESLQEAFAQEELVGNHFRRVKRKLSTVDTNGAEDWDVLGNAERKFGNYFIVDNGKTERGP